MGSHGSTGASNGVYYEEPNVGQKRKRVTTRKSARDEQKRRELETTGDAFLSYIPPPQPPIKAKDVHVPVIRDVSRRFGCFLFFRIVLTENCSIHIQKISRSMMTMATILWPRTRN
jgi:hypothetical protein